MMVTEPVNRLSSREWGEKGAERKKRRGKTERKGESVNYEVVFSLTEYLGHGSRDGAVVRALASHQCVPGSIPGPGVICGLSLLLVFFLAPKGFSPGTPVYHSPQETNISKFQLDLDICQALNHEPLARVIAQALPVFDIYLYILHLLYCVSV